eukprot:scaffold1145_cov34-Prasinocladus_malaysianus.AAC.1
MRWEGSTLAENQDAARQVLALTPSNCLPNKLRPAAAGSLYPGTFQLIAALLVAECSDDRCLFQCLCDWIDHSGESSTVFDFPTKGILQYAITHCEYHRLAKDGKPTGLIGWWPERAVTFVDNHDTGGSQ